MNELIAKALGVAAGSVDWRATFLLATMRSAAAGATWALLALLTGNGESFFTFLLLGAPIGLLFMVPMALVGLLGAKIFPPVGLLGLIPLVYMVSGDPLLWLVDRFRPDTVPMDDFKPINGKTILIVFNPQVVEFVQNAKAEAMSAATAMGRDTFAKFRDQAGEKAAAFKGGTGAGAASAPQSDQAIYEDALDKFNRLVATGGNGEARREQLLRIGALCDAGCAIPGPYIFIADKFAQVDLVGKFDLVVHNLQNGHAKCAGNRAHQEEIENFYYALGKLCWDQGRELLAFRAYMDGLDRWRQAGNTISQSSPLLPRIAFVASRMFAKNALERNDNTDPGVELLNFCEASDVDMNLEIDVSDAPRAPG